MNRTTAASRKGGKIDILDRSIPARTIIFSLVLPSFVEELGMILANYIDTAMVGRIGVNASAAIAVNHPILMLTNGFNYGLAIGFSVMLARYIGEGSREEARGVMRNAMFHTLWFGSLLTLSYVFVIAPNFARWMNADPAIWKDAGDYIRWLGYSRFFLAMMSVNCNILRGMGDTRRPMLCNVAHNVLNVVFNYFLIYPSRTVSLLGASLNVWGAGQGVAGAAMATSAANVLSGLLSMYFVLKKDNAVTFDRRIIGCDPMLLKRTYRLGLPIALERLVISGGQLVTTRMLAGLGNAVIAAHSFANTAESICYMPVNGFGVAATTIVAQWLGAKDPARAVELGNKSIKYACIVMGFCASAMFVFAPQLISIFTDSREVIEMAALALRVQAFAELFVAISNTTSGILRGAGDTNYASILTVSGMWLVRVPMAFVLIRYFGFGLLGVWFPMALDWTLRCILMTVRYRRGKWKNVWKAA